MPEWVTCVPIMFSGLQSWLSSPTFFFSCKSFVSIWSQPWARAPGWLEDAWWFQGAAQAEARPQGKAEGPLKGLCTLKAPSGAGG